jgi:hypothetical protein
MQFSLFSVFVLAFVNVAFCAPVVGGFCLVSGISNVFFFVSQPKGYTPVVMNIEKHSLDDDPVTGSQGILSHEKFLLNRELEEEEFEASLLTPVGSVSASELTVVSFA